MTTSFDSPTITQVREDIYCIQLGRHGLLSCFLVDGPKPTLVDAASAASLEDIVSAMEQIGVPPDDLSNVIVSHIHLDHSGAAAGLAELADDASVYIHESTAHHLVEPARLIESTKRTLGDAFDELGAPDPLSQAALEPIDDTDTTLDTGRVQLEILHTPGHAPDHLAVDILDSDVLIANEAIGRYYPNADSWIPPITLPNFDIDAVRGSIEAIQAREPEVIGLSHTGTVQAESALDRAADRLETFTTTIPRVFDETEDVEATIARVRSDLLSFAGAYPSDVEASQADICTRGILDALDIQ